MAMISYRMHKFTTGSVVLKIIIKWKRSKKWLFKDIEYESIQEKVRQILSEDPNLTCINFAEELKVLNFTKFSRSLRKLSTSFLVYSTKIKIDTGMKVHSSINK